MKFSVLSTTQSSQSLYLCFFVQTEEDSAALGREKVHTIWEPSELEAIYSRSKTDIEFGKVNENEDKWIVINYSKQGRTQHYMDDLFERVSNFYRIDKHKKQDELENVHWIQAEVDTPSTKWMLWSAENEIT